MLVNKVSLMEGLSGKNINMWVYVLLKLLLLLSYNNNDDGCCGVAVLSPLAAHLHSV